MFCRNCGKEIEGEFCKYCGAKAEEPQKQMETERPAEKKDKRPTAGRQSFKKSGLLAAGVLLLAVAATAGWMFVQRAKAAEVFSDKVTAFKDACGDYRLGDLEEDYQALLEEAEKIMENKDRSAYTNTEDKMDQFQEELQEYMAKIGQYGSKREEYSGLKEYILTNEQKGRYESLLADLEKGFEENSLVSIEQSIANFDVFYKEWENEFRRLVQDDKDEAARCTASGMLLEAESQMLNSELDRALACWDEESYGEAILSYERSASLLDNAKKAGNYEIQVKQVEASSYPEIRLYISAYDPQTDRSVEVSKEQITLKELVQGSYVDAQINRVSKLDQKENLNVCLVADVSGSMWGQIDLVQRSMTSFLDCLQYDVGDKASLITFDNFVTMNADFTGDKNTLIREVNSMYVGNATALYDALYVAVCKASVTEGAKCVIAFTDGYDNVSTTTKESVMEAARQYGVPIYLIGIGRGIDEASLQFICSSTGGSYWNVFDGSAMQAIYNSIYQKNKEMYLVEYTSSIQDINALQNIYLAYDDNDTYMRCEAEFEPARIKASEDEYEKLVQDNGIANADIEDEVLRIREVYNEIVQNRDSGRYTETAVMDGVTKYTENGSVRCVIAGKGVDGIAYARYYYFENGKLIFAYLEAGDSHRLYFYNERLFRWRYASNAVNFSEADNHDNEDSQEFREWENLALDEAYRYSGL